MSRRDLLDDILTGFLVGVCLVAFAAVIALGLWGISRDTTTSHPCRGTTGVYDLDGRPYTVPNDPRCVAGEP